MFYKPWIVGSNTVVIDVQPCVAMCCLARLLAIKQIKWDFRKLFLVLSTYIVKKKIKNERKIMKKKSNKVCATIEKFAELLVLQKKKKKKKTNIL